MIGSWERNALDFRGRCGSPAGEFSKMALFVHLTTEARVPSITRNGIGRLRQSQGELPRGIYATPVTQNFYASHQWVRELKRSKAGPLAGIYFRIPDEQFVWLGHYGKAHQELTASQTLNEFSKAKDPLGWEVLIPRRIEAKEIVKTRRLSQVIGWRYYPGAKGRVPCTCDFCIRGEFGAAKLRKRLGCPDRDLD
jgi:hypothetical protein